MFGCVTGTGNVNVLYTIAKSTRLHGDGGAAPHKATFELGRACPFVVRADPARTNLTPRPPRAQDVFADCTWTPRAAVGDPQTHSDHRGQGRAGVPPKFQNLRSKLKLRPVIANAVHTRSRTRHTTQTWRPVTKSAQRLIQDLPCQATELEQESRQAVLGSHGHGHHGIAVQ